MYFVTYIGIDGTVVTINTDDRYEVVSIMEELQYANLTIVDYSR